MKPQPISFGPVSLIPGDKEAKFPYCNSLYIADARLIIDPSSNREILVELRRQGRIDTVCLSHWHEDHFRFLYLLDDTRFWISEMDATPLGNGREFLSWYGLDAPGTEELRRMIMAKMVTEIRYQARTPDRFLEDGDIIDLGSVSMEVIASPGHSPGHRSFYFPELSLLFLGDYNLDPFGPWTGDPFSDIDQCIATIQRLRRVPARVLLAGHRLDPIVSGAEALWDGYLDTIRLREEKLSDFLREPRTLDEIIDKWLVLGKPKEPIAYFRFGEKAHVEKHLARLLRQKTIHKEGEVYRRS